MPKNVNFDINVNDIIKAVFDGLDTSKNDLFIVVENGSSSNLRIDHMNDWGDWVGSTSDSNVVDAVKLDAADPKANVWASGWTGANYGCGGFIYVTRESDSRRWGVYARTNPNMENYFQIAESMSMSKKELLDKAQDHTEHESSDGWHTAVDHCPDLKMSVSITNGGDVTRCLVRFEER